MSQVPGLQFGSGYLFATPTSANLPSDPTPQQVGVIQNIKMTVGADIKELYGQYQWSVDSAIGKRSIKGSFEFAEMSNALFNNLFFADAVAAGVIATQPNESHTIPATPYQITIAPPSSGVFTTDQGVVYAATGIALTKVPSGSPAAGQYKVDPATGIYTFAAADTTLDVFISYSYAVSSLGTTLAVGNHFMGYGPILSATILFPYQNYYNGFNLPNIRLGKIDFTTKLDDYTMMSTDFSAFAGAGGNPLNIFSTQ